MAQAHVIPEAFPVPKAARMTISIVGSSLVGRGLARLARQQNFPVRVVDSQPGRSIEPSELGAASLIIEATGDDIEAKCRTLRELDAAVGRECVLATHTAGNSVTKLAAATKHPERVVGLHLPQPLGQANAVEVIRALQTSDSAHERACRFVRALGKTVIATKDQPGFLFQRLLVPLLNEACFALQEGLGSVEDIDAATRLGTDNPGPLRMADSIGLDQCLSTAERLQREFGDAKYRPAPLLRNYVAAGWLGRKTGRGFYSYR